MHPTPCIQQRFPSAERGHLLCVAEQTNSQVDDYLMQTNLGL